MSQSQLPAKFVSLMRQAFEANISEAPWLMKDLRRATDNGEGYANPSVDIAWQHYCKGAESILTMSDAMLKRVKEMK